MSAQSYESVIPDDFKWMKKGMSVRNDPVNNAIRIDGKNYINLDQFERTYGPTTSGDKLAKDCFWHVKGMFAWHDSIKAQLLSAKNRGAVSVHLDDLLTGHDIPKEYIAYQLHWWGFMVRNELVNLWSSKANLKPNPPRKPNLRLV